MAWIVPHWTGLVPSGLGRTRCGPDWDRRGLEWDRCCLDRVPLVWAGTLKVGTDQGRSGPGLERPGRGLVWPGLVPTGLGRSPQEWDGPGVVRTGTGEAWSGTGVAGTGTEVAWTGAGTVRTGGEDRRCPGGEGQHPSRPRKLPPMTWNLGATRVGSMPVS